MSNEFRGTGNVAHPRVFFDPYRQDATGAAEQVGGFWLDVNVWGSPRAEEVAQHVAKGARVHVIGRMAERRWTVSATGEVRRALCLNAERTFFGLSRIATVEYKPRRATFRARA
jgi:single-stranded DNA-binding protein